MKLVLAPMEGLTDPTMRQVLTTVGKYDWCVTEFIRVTTSVLPDHIFYKYCPELHNNGLTAAGTPVHIQLLGNDPQLLAMNAARAVALGALAIDLNFGCPAKTVNRHRGGAILLDEPDVVFNIVQAVRQAVASHIPVSAKMRLGYLDDSKTLDNAQAIAQAGASWLTIHARTKVDGYNPPAYWYKIAAVKHSIAIPIIANGEIWSREDAVQCQQESGCVDLMLGRGAVTRPDLVNHIRYPETLPLSWQQLVVFQQLFLGAHGSSPEGLVGRYKQWLGMLTRGYPEAAVCWQMLKKEKELTAIRQYLQDASMH